MKWVDYLGTPCLEISESELKEIISENAEYLHKRTETINEVVVYRKYDEVITLPGVFKVGRTTVPDRYYFFHYLLAGSIYKNDGLYKSTHTLPAKREIFEYADRQRSIFRDDRHYWKNLAVDKMIKEH